ncbi:hypothetical protein TNCV_2048791 [Trichonephila clavipes]|nr:hypothetical protein TNCV_2048791 [Trichonephila clavipes]
MAYHCTSRAGWLAAADCFRMTKSLALKATGADLNVRSNRAMEIGGLYGLWEFRSKSVRRRKTVSPMLLEEQVPERILRIVLTGPMLLRDRLLDKKR